MKVLVIAPHPDDEILGVGATMAKHIKEGNDVYVVIATKGVSPLYNEDENIVVCGEALRCHEFLGIKKTIFLDIPAVMLESLSRYEMNDKIMHVIHEIEPDEVYLPHYGDMQKDHQMIFESAMVALRPKYKHKVSRVYTYETLSETGWHAPTVMNEFVPTIYNNISDYLDIKLKAMSYYHSQLSSFPDPRSLEAIESLAKFRGSTCCCAAAEAFQLIREIKL